MASVSIKLATSVTELNQIIELQRQNLRAYLSDAEKASQGFVIAQYSLPFLKSINEVSPAIILKTDEVVGYAIAVTKTQGSKHPLLSTMFSQFDKQTHHGVALAEEDYIVVGQLCVAKNFRAKGYVDQLYSFFKANYQSYSYCLTAIDSENYRSLAVHRRCGFKKIGTLTLGERPGQIVIWDWKKEHSPKP
jgi:predicted GNAT superfamily acetyltransferase